MKSGKSGPTSLLTIPFNSFRSDVKSSSLSVLLSLRINAKMINADKPDAEPVEVFNQYVALVKILGSKSATTKLIKPFKNNSATNKTI